MRSTGLKSTESIGYGAVGVIMEMTFWTGQHGVEGTYCGTAYQCRRRQRLVAFGPGHTLAVVTHILQCLFALSFHGLEAKIICGIE